MTNYTPLVKRNRVTCLVYFYYIIGLVLIWSVYGILKITDPANARRLIFVETAEPVNGTVELTPRQVCAIESAVLANPGVKIELYITDVEEIKPIQDSLWSIIYSFPNVEVKLINFTATLLETPLGRLIESNRLESDKKFLIWHKSDLLRFALLWKKPSAYLDTDIISFRPFSTLGSTWLVHQHAPGVESVAIGGSVMSFGADSVGRKMINWVIDDLLKTYNGQNWADSSVGVLTRAARKQCESQPLTGGDVQDCNGLKLWSYDKFYAVPWKKAIAFFDDKTEYSQLREALNVSVGTHLWNYLSHEVSVKKDSPALINQLAKRYCPAVYAMVEKNL